MNEKNPFNIPLSAISPKDIGTGNGAYPVMVADCVGSGVNGEIGHVRFQSGPHSGTGRYMSYELALRMAEYACIAINNHDRLVEENRRLREALALQLASPDAFFSNQNKTVTEMSIELLSELDCQPQTGSVKQEFKPLDFVEIGRLEK